MHRIPARRFLAVLSPTLLAALAACAGANTSDLTQGTTGLSSALPGGDGRALAAYKLEFRANALQGTDSLMLRFSEVWQWDNREYLPDLYSEDVTLVTPDGQLLQGRNAVLAYADWQLPQISGIETWRDEFAVSGLMAFIYGRYETDSSQPAGDHRGVHVTIAKRDHFTWQIRSKMYLAFGGSGVLTRRDLLSPEPPHLTLDSIRARYGERALNGQDERAEWMVDAYLSANSYLSEFRYAWNNDDFESAVSMLAPGAVVRLPWDVPVVGKTNAAYSLERLLPAVGDLNMSILDFDVSERISFCMGRYTLPAGDQVLTGYYTAVIRLQDEGPQLTALLFSGSGANGVATEKLGGR